VIEFGDIAGKMLALHLVVGAEQEPFEIRQRDVDRGEQDMGRLVLLATRGRGVVEALLVEIPIPLPASFTSIREVP